MILVTGFEPFGGEPVNASWEAVSRLPASLVDATGAETTLERRLLPVSFVRAADAVTALVETLRPDAVVCTGVAAGRRVLSVEARAVNRADARVPDNDGAAPQGVPVLAGAPATLATTLPVRDLAAGARSTGAPVSTSLDAGTYVCNSTLYSALAAARRLAGAGGVHVPGVGFVHVPPLDVLPVDMTVAALGSLLRAVAAHLWRGTGPGVLTVGGALATRLRPVTLPGGRAPRIGISGGVGAGKSSLTQVFREGGAVVADADELAHSVVEPGTPGLSRVAAEFGAGVLAPDGSLDRAALARLVFADEDARRRLEAIVHPLVARAAREAMRAAPTNTLAVYDVPLLVETGMEDLFDAVLVVDAPLDQRLERLARRGLDREEALRRIAAQADAARRRAAATIWVDNAGSLDDLRGLTARVIGRWLVRAD